MLLLQLKLRRTLVTALLGTSIAAVGFSAPALAKEIPYQTPADLESKCNDAGGTYYPPGESGVHMCTGTTGNIIACGGVGKYKNRCDAYDAARSGAGQIRLVQMRSLAASAPAATLE